MDNFKPFDDFPEEDVKLIAYCPFCEADLNPVQAKIVANRQDAMLVHLQCSKCFTYILALITQLTYGTGSIGLITDLNFDDVYKFKQQTKISADEVLDLHQKLNQSNLVKELINK